MPGYRNGVVKTPPPPLHWKRPIRKMKPNSHASHHPGWGNQVEVVQEPWKGTPTLLGEDKRVVGKGTIKHHQRLRRVPQGMCTNRMRAGLKCPAVGPESPLEDSTGLVSVSAEMDRAWSRAWKGGIMKRPPFCDAAVGPLCSSLT